MMRDSAPPVVERLGLEDVAEEEDAFLGEESSKIAVDTGNCQVCVRTFSILSLFINLPSCLTICSL